MNYKDFWWALNFTLILMGIFIYGFVCLTYNWKREDQRVMIYVLNKKIDVLREEIMPSAFKGRQTSDSRCGTGLQGCKAK